MIKFTHRGSFKNIEKFLDRSRKLNFLNTLNKYGKEGVNVLSAATPKDTGLTSSSWDYIIENRRTGYALSWKNNNINEGVVIAIILQYGHGTGSGYFVEGVDYINPVMRPLFDRLVEELWKEVTIL